jgi:dTDP-4-amino-4,6-dideoxygalactose transaminase
LPHLDSWNAARARVAAGYRERLAHLPLRFQAVGPNESHVYHLFQVRTSHRPALMEWLSIRDIEVSIRYPTPIHLQPAFRHLGFEPGAFPVAESLARELFCLPIRPDMREDELDYVTDSIHRFFRSRT